MTTDKNPTTNEDTLTAIETTALDDVTWLCRVRPDLRERSRACDREHGQPAGNSVRLCPALSRSREARIPTARAGSLGDAPDNLGHG